MYTTFQHPDSKQSLEQLYADFKEHFDAWAKAYDVTTMTGDMTVRQDEFGKAREDINIMGELLDA